MGNVLRGKVSFAMDPWIAISRSIFKGDWASFRRCEIF